MEAKHLKSGPDVLAVLDLSKYDFDPGFRGFAERFSLMVKHGTVRSMKLIRISLNTFLGMHYFYIVAWTFILSWILYPQRNISYTDALFEATSAVTLTGLTVVSPNDLKLYQQIFVFIVPLFTNQITVATIMVYHRLWMYRRKFHDIEIVSKQQSRERRGTSFSTHDSQAQRHEPGKRRFKFRAPHLRRAFSMPNLRHEKQSLLSMGHSSVGLHSPDEGLDTGKAAGDYEPISDESPNEKEENYASDETTKELDASKIQFDDLPRPNHDNDHTGKEKDQNIRSRKREQMQHANKDEDDPPLVVRNPRTVQEQEDGKGESGKLPNSNIAKPAREEDCDGEPESRRSHSGIAGRTSDASVAVRERFHELLQLSNNQMSRLDNLISEASSHEPRQMLANYLSYASTLGQNSAFIGLTEEQKDELGGVEYRALKLLRWITFAYIAVMMCLGFLTIIPWVYERHTYAEIIRAQGVSPVTFAMTTVLSAFNNHGLCVLPASLSQFWHSAYVPLFVSLLILSGNVSLPVLMRLGVYAAFKLSPKSGQTRETLGFLLDHPRRCFMLMFPRVTTIWLFVALIVFFIVEVAFFMILNCGTHSPEPDMATGPRLLSAFFQSISTRTAGFTLINIAGQHPAMLVLNILTMYAGVYPIAMSIRKTNVFEEQTLGRYYRDEQEKDSASRRTDNAVEFTDEKEKGTATAEHPTLRHRLSDFSARFLGQDEDLDNSERKIQKDKKEMGVQSDDDMPSSLVEHMRRQLSTDLWFLALGLFLITLTEGGSISRGEFGLFDVMYEVISAHSTVGLSIGRDGSWISLCGSFSKLGKIVFMALMIRGRHRDLPYDGDRAVILHFEDLHRRDAEQEKRVREAKRLVPHGSKQKSGSSSRHATPFSTIWNDLTRTERNADTPSAGR